MKPLDEEQLENILKSRSIKDMDQGKLQSSEQALWDMLQKKSGKTYSNRWLPLLVWLATAAVVLAVIGTLWKTDKETDNSNGHFVDEGNQSPLSGIRYVGQLGKGGILELPGKDGKQKNVSLGDEIEGYKIIEITFKHLVFLSPEGLKLLLPIKSDKLIRVESQNPELGKSLVPKYVKPFVLEGRFLDFDGKPVPGQRIKLIGANPESKGGMESRLSYETNENGYYQFRWHQEIFAMIAEYRGSSIRVEGPFDKNSVVDFDFSKYKFVKLTGTVKNEKGDPLPSLQIQAENNEKALLNATVASAKTDDEGKFQILAGRPVDYLIITGTDPKTTEKIGFLAQGPWKTDSTLNLVSTKIQNKITLILKDQNGKPLQKGIAKFSDKNGTELFPHRECKDGRVEFEHLKEIGSFYLSVEGGSYYKDGIPGSGEFLFDLSREKPVVLTGTTQLDEHTPMVSHIMFYSLAGNFIGSCASDSKGKFSFFANDAIGKVVAETAMGANAMRTELEGVWNESQTLLLEYGKEKIIKLQGKLTWDGKTPCRFSLYFHNAKGKILKLATVDEEGKYFLACNQAVAYISVNGSFGACIVRGPWDKDAVVDINLNDQGYYILRGRILDTQNKPLNRALLKAYNKNGHLISSASPDMDGNYTMAMSDETTRVIASTQVKDILVIEKSGLWNKNSELNIDFSKEKLFTLDIEILDKDGKRIESKIKEGTITREIRIFLGSGCQTTFECKNGFGTIQSNVEIQSLSWMLGNRVMGQTKGPWNKSTQIRLQEKE